MALTKVGKEGITGISNSSDATAITIDSSENVGIGTSSPSVRLDTRLGTTTGKVAEFHNSAGYGIGFTVESDGGVNTINAETNQALAFATNGTSNERMRIDSSGNLLVGTTDTTPYNNSANSTADNGIALGGTGIFSVAKFNDSPLIVNRTGTNDGEVIKIHKSGSAVGSIGVVDGDNLFISSTASAHAGLRFNNTAMAAFVDGAASDNTMDIGTSIVRFDDIYATNTSIIGTSDQNEKQQIASLTTAEMTAAKAISALFKTFKWNDAVADKGGSARKHTGHIAQEVQTAMTDAGLDAADYAFWCSNTWWEAAGKTYETADEAPAGATQRTRLGLRYSELLAFVGAATEQRLADIETRLTALENAE